MGSDFTLTIAAFAARERAAQTLIREMEAMGLQRTEMLLRRAELRLQLKELRRQLPLLDRGLDDILHKLKRL
jgi:hypothetical protein